MKKFFLVLVISFLPAFININAQRFQMAANIGSSADDYGRALAVDSAGYIYLTGHFQGSNVDFDPGPAALLLSSSGEEDIFLAKYDSTLNCIWAIAIGGTKDDISMRLLLDNSGNIYIAGWFHSPLVDFDPGPGIYNVTAEAEPNLWFAKFNNDGNLIWVNTVGGIWMAGIHDITFDNNGSLLAGGYFCGTNVNFNPRGNPILLSSLYNSGDVFFAKYDTAGVCLFAKNCSGNMYETVNGLRTDALGNIYIYGPFRSTVDFDPGPATASLTSTGDFDVFFAKYTSSGEYVWAKSIGGSAFDNSGGLYFDTGGNLHLSALFSGQADFDPGSGTAYLNSNGGTDIAFAVYDPEGNYVSAVSIGGTGDDGPGIQSIDSNQNVYYCGYFTGQNVDFDPGPGTSFLSSVGACDLFISKYNSSGNLIWAKSSGGSGFDFCSGTFIDSKGYLHITGEFSGSDIDFDPGVGINKLSSHGGQDIFIAKFSADLKKEYLGLAVPDTIPKRFGTPELITNGSWGWHGSPVFSPDETKMIFVKYFFDLPAGNMKIYEMDDVNGIWTDPYRPSYASDSSDSSPVFTPDGKQLMFGSLRSGSWKLYFVNKTITGWSSPQLLDFDYNSFPGQVGLNFSLASDGTMYIDMATPGDNVQLCKANLVNGTYTQFEILPAPVNTEYQESAPCIAPDQSFILFSSNKPGSIGLHDIYISFKNPDNSWTPVQNMGSRINGGHEDVFPFLSPDKRFLFFVSAKQNDLAYNAYWVSSEVINKINPFVTVNDQTIFPVGMNLYQNYPNPFNPSTTIKYSVEHSGIVKITVHDILGRLVDVIVDEYKSPGLYTTLYNAGSLSSGVYFYKIEAAGFRQVKKFVFLK